MFKLSVAFISLVLVQSVFAAPVLLTVSNPNAGAVGLTNRHADGAPGRTHTTWPRDLPDTDDTLDEFTRRQAVGPLLGSIVPPMQSTPGEDGQSGSSALGSSTGSAQTQQLGVDNIVPGLLARNTGGLIDTLLSSFLGSEDTHSGNSQRRRAASLRIVNGALDKLIQDSSNQQKDRRELPPLGTLTNSVDPNQVANQNTDAGSALNPGGDKAGNALDPFNSVVKHVDADDDGEDGDDDNDDDNGEDDGGDEVDDNGEDDGGDEVDDVDDDVDDADDVDDDADDVDDDAEDVDDDADDVDDDVDDDVQNGDSQNGDDNNAGDSDNSNNADNDADSNGNADSDADNNGNADDDDDADSKRRDVPLRPFRFPPPPVPSRSTSPVGTNA